MASLFINWADLFFGWTVASYKHPAVYSQLLLAVFFHSIAVAWYWLRLFSVFLKSGSNSTTPADWGGGNQLRGLHPDKVRRDCSDSEEDLQRWHFWPLVGVAAKEPHSLFLVSSSQSWLGINALLDQLFWVREEVVVLGEGHVLFFFRDGYW